MNASLKLTKKDFASDQEVRWCPGCGDYAILSATQQVFPTLGIPKEKFVIVSLLAILLFAILFAVSRKPAIRTTAILLAVLAFVTRGIDVVMPSAVLDAIALLCMVAILFLIIGAGLRVLFRPMVVTINTISASLCVYILMVLLWANLYSLVDLLLPGSFAYSLDENFTMNMRDGQAIYATYYSFVTITTLGYGDILPVSPPAMALATLQAFVGQMYVAILVARLVSVYSSPATEPSAQGDSDLNSTGN